MKARVKWVQDVMFVAESGSGHAVVIDGAPEAGGRNIGFRPMELILMGLGSCSAFDVVMILRRSRQQISDCVVEVTAQRATTDPKIFTHIEMKYVVSGIGLDANKVQRAVDLSAEKYCSATAIMVKSAQITHVYEIKETPIAT